MQLPLIVAPTGAKIGSGDFEKAGILGVIRPPRQVAVFILLRASDLDMAAITINPGLPLYLVIGTRFILSDGSGDPSSHALLKADG